MAATIIESFFQRSLEDMVKGLRVQVIGEAAFLSKALNEVRKEIKSMDVRTKAVALQKLTYLNMLQGTDMSWAAFHVVEVMSMPKFSVKKIGYLAASQSFTESTDVLLLITNLLRKDLGGGGKNEHESSLAIECVSRVATPDLARDLLPDLFPLLASGRPFLKRKATVALWRVFTQYPDAIRVALKRLIERLNDGDPSVVTAAISVLCDLAFQDPRPFLPLAPELYNLLVHSPNTWLCIKLVKILGVMVPLEPRLGKKIAEPICEVVRKSQATSLLLECIEVVTSGLTEQQGAVVLCVEKLSALMQEDDTNVKYLCLRALLNLMPVHPWAVAANNEAIAQCLSHRDPSIQKGARRLIFGMVSESNVTLTVQVLLQCAIKADVDACNEIVSSILWTCSADDYLLISDYSWYVSSLTEMARIPHCDHGDEIGRQLVDIGLRVNSATGDVLRAARDLLLDVALLGHAAAQGVLKAAAWIAGEYVACSVNLDELVEALLQPRTMSLPASVRALYVQAVLKVFVYSWSKRFRKESFINADATNCSQYLADKPSGPQYMSEADSSFMQSPSKSEPEQSAVQPGDRWTKRPESHFIEESEILSGDSANVEHMLRNEDDSQVLNNGQDMSSVTPGEERGVGDEVKEQEKGETGEEQQSLLKSLEPMFEMIAGTMTALATSSDVEIQERACNLLGLLQVLKDISSFPFRDERPSPEVQFVEELWSALLGVLTVELSPESPQQQGRITAAEGLILENLDALGPAPVKDEGRGTVIDREALPEWEGRKFFSFQGSSDSSVLGESSALLAQHRQRHQNFYLSSEGNSTNKFSYPPPVHAYADPDQLPRADSTGSAPPGESTKSSRSRARPVVVKLDDDEDHLESSVKVKQRDLKDDFISNAIIDMLSGAPAQKHRVTGQHSSRLSRSSDRENNHRSSSRVKDKSTLGRGLGKDQKLPNSEQEPGIVKSGSRHRHSSHEKETISSSSLGAGYEPQGPESLGSTKGRSRPRRSGSHKGTSLSKKLSDAGPSPDSEGRL